MNYALPYVFPAVLYVDAFLRFPYHLNTLLIVETTFISYVAIALDIIRLIIFIKVIIT